MVVLICSCQTICSREVGRRKKARGCCIIMRRHKVALGYDFVEIFQDKENAPSL